MKGFWISMVCNVALVASCAAQSMDALGVHNLHTGGPSPVQGSLSPCMFCHAPHSSGTGASGLWSQKLSNVSNYTLYDSATLTNVPQQPALGSVSNQCLSCHDGTVAPGMTSPYGNLKMTGAMLPQDVFGTDLSSVHPFNFKLPLSPNTQNIASSVIAGTGTGNSKVKLINKNVECTSCHNPHNQFLDSATNAFLVVDNSGSALCLACHDTAPSSAAMKATGSQSHAAASTVVSTAERLSARLDGWKLSAHAISNYKTRRGSVVGQYSSLALGGCASCHTEHKGGKSTSLLRQASSGDAANLDASTRNCVICHNGSSNVSPSAPNVLSEINKGGHPFPAASAAHVTGESALLDGNRHATCVDCHNPHQSRTAGVYSSTTLRPAQTGAVGISQNDGRTVVQTAAYQYETCLRCHGSSTGKQQLLRLGYLPNHSAGTADPLNVLLQFGTSTGSSHPVMHDRSSALPQPSLRSNVMMLDGHTAGRAMGSRILCSDCHNSDDNREFGGSGASGPHGSFYPHILERRYEMSQVATGASGGPGTKIQNLYPSPALDGACSTAPCVSPYALCAKCHDLAKLSTASSFSEHARHLAAGFSCSVCHTAHGVGAASSSGSGQRLVSFDLNVVGSNNGQAITYSRATNSCSLICHGHAHSLKLSAAAATAVHTAK